MTKLFKLIALTALIPTMYSIASANNSSLDAAIAAYKASIHKREPAPTEFRRDICSLESLAIQAYMKEFFKKDYAKDVICSEKKLKNHLCTENGIPKYVYRNILPDIARMHCLRTKGAYFHSVNHQKMPSYLDTSFRNEFLKRKNAGFSINELLRLRILSKDNGHNDKIINLYSKRINNLAGLKQLNANKKRVLFCCANNISYIPDEIFKKFSKLTSMTLANNKITHIQSNAFKYLTQVSELHLSDNQLCSIAQDGFSDLSNLRYLSLENNNLTDIPSGTFDGLNNLTTVNLQNNPLYDTAKERIRFEIQKVAPNADIIF